MDFELPADLNELSAEELSSLIETARTEFNALNESDDISNETLESMQSLADSIESIVGEQSTRLAAARKVELSAQVEAASTEVEEVEETVEVELASEDAVTDDEDEVEIDAVEEFAAEIEDESVEEIISDSSTTPKEVVVAASNPQVKVPEAKPLVVIAAAVDVPQFYVGQRLDPSSLADAVHQKAKMLSDSRGNQTVYPVATIERPFAPEYDLEGLDQAGMWDRISEGSQPSALTASGGWCAPSEIVYDLFEVECASERLFTLPTFRVTRGGVRWPVFTPHDEAFNPGFVWTEANDIAATGGTPTKPCVRIPCPTFTECRLDAVGLCITAGNLQDRAYPEQVKWFINRAVRAFERNNAIRKLNLVLADTQAVTLAATFGAASALVAGLLQQAADYRQQNGLCYDETLDLYAPSWLTDLVKSDIARQQDSLNGCSGCGIPSDSDVASWFANANLRLHYIDNWQEFVHPALVYPATVQVLISYPGAYVEFNGGRLDLGVIRDSTLNATNDYTAVWFEEFYCVGRRGPQGRLVTIPVCASGDVGGRVTAPGAIVCPA